MAKQTILQDVKERIQELQDKKAADLKTVYEKKAAAATQKEAAEIALKDATERMDVEAYEKAKQEINKAQTLIDMYGGRYSQISKQEYISEADSDSVLDSLNAYEEELAEGFKAAIEEPLSQLNKLLQDYRAEVADVEQTIKTWETCIHANYRSDGTIYAETGTNKSPSPVPFHRFKYTGCSEATQLENYLDKAGMM